MRNGEQTEAQIIDLVRQVADEVYDPCSMAIGLNVGLAEMGLIREIAAAPGFEGWEVRIRLRLTSPGCQYFFYFQEEMERRLLMHAEIASIRVEWDQVLDWTPDDLSSSAKAKIERRNKLVLHPRA